MLSMANAMKPMIIALVGNSGSGKTTLAKKLTEYNIFPTLVSYTTRPIRNDETDGVDHYFVTENDMPPKNYMLAYTYFGGYHYWTALHNIVKMKDVPHIYVIDEKGLLDLYELEKQDVCDVIWIQVERTNNDVDEKRKERDNERIPYLQELHAKGYRPAITINNNSNIDAVCMQFISKLFNALQ